jgi:hypothetical protein
VWNSATACSLISATLSIIEALFINVEIRNGNHPCLQKNCSQSTADSSGRLSSGSFRAARPRLLSPALLDAEETELPGLFSEEQFNRRFCDPWKVGVHLKARDAVVIFESVAPDSVQVNEIIQGEHLRHQKTQRSLRVVTEMESKYMFFANEADIARKQVMRGRSCMFDVFFREP